MLDLLTMLRKPPIAGIELRENECRITQLIRAAGGYSVIASFVVDFGPLPADPAARTRAKADALKAALRQRKIKISHGRLCVSKSAVTVRCRQMPPTESEEELDQMVTIEAERHIPFKAERHQIDYHVMASEPLQGSHVAIVAVDGPVIQEAIDVCSQAGIDLALADVSSLSLYRLARMRIPPAALSEPGEGAVAVAVVHVDRNNTDVAIVHKGVMVFARNAGVGVQGLLESLGAEAPGDVGAIDALEGAGASGPEDSFQRLVAEGIAPVDSDGGGPAAAGKPRNRRAETRLAVQSWLARLTQEIRRAYEFARREFNCDAIGELLLSGDGLRIAHLSEYLRNALNVQVRPLLGQTFPGVKIAVAASVDEPVDSAALAVGVALENPEGQPKRVNLLPAEYLRRQRMRRQMVSFLTTGALLLGVFVLGFAYLSRLRADKHARFMACQEYVRKNRAKVEELKKMEFEIGIFKEFRDPGRNVLRILDYLCGLDIVKTNVRLFRFNYIQGKELRLSGHGFSIEDINVFEAAVKKSGFFEDVTITNREVTDLWRQKVYRFDITCAFPKTGEGGKQR